MASCSGCAACKSGPDSVLACDPCSRPGEVYASALVFAHSRPGLASNWTEIRPAPSAGALVTRERRRGARTTQVPVCPKCGGELVRR